MAGEKKTTGKRFEDMICPVCKRVFTVPDPGMWAYKIYKLKTGRYQCACSWKCIQKHNRQAEEEKQKKREERKKNRKAM